MGSRTVIIDRVSGVKLHNRFGDFESGVYRIWHRGRTTEHLLLYKQLTANPCLVRLNSACFTGDLFGCQRCDCHWQLEAAVRTIAQQQQGLLIYDLHDDGRGNGTLEKLRTHARSDEDRLSSKEAFEREQLPPDARDYGPALAILHDLDVKVITLLSNSPAKRACIEQAGIVVSDMMPLMCPDPEVAEYYRWKRSDFGHLV